MKLQITNIFNKDMDCLLNITKQTKCLLVAPHPVDDIIGAGGLLIKYANNFDCICIGSSGVELQDPYITAKARSDLRIKEFNEIMDMVGVKHHWIFETYGVPRFDDQIESHFAEYCQALKNLKQYDYIFLPHPLDGHHEHRFITNKIFKRILKKVGYNQATKIVFYEVWADIQFPNTFFDISGSGFLYSTQDTTDTQDANSKINLFSEKSLFDLKLKIAKLYRSQWDYDDIYSVPTIKRSIQRPIERYRVLPVNKYLKLLSLSFKYGIVGLGV